MPTKKTSKQPQPSRNYLFSPEYIAAQRNQEWLKLPAGRRLALALTFEECAHFLRDSVAQNFPKHVHDGMLIPDPFSPLN